MMGRRQESQVQFLYAFDLDKVIPADHLVRQIDAILDLSWVHRELGPYYSHTGCLSQLGSAPLTVTHSRESANLSSSCLDGLASRTRFKRGFKSRLKLCRR